VVGEGPRLSGIDATQEVLVARSNAEGAPLTFEHLALPGRPAQALSLASNRRGDAVIFAWVVAFPTPPGAAVDASTQYAESCAGGPFGAFSTLGAGSVAASALGEDGSLAVGWYADVPGQASQARLAVGLLGCPADSRT